MLPGGLLVETLSHPFLYDNSPLRALAKAGTQTVTVGLADEPGLAVNDLKGALNTTRHAEATASALLFIYPHYLPHRSACHEYTSYVHSGRSALTNRSARHQIIAFAGERFPEAGAVLAF